jgi:hypothetical protein
MKIKAIILSTIIAASTAFTAVAATHQNVSGLSSWGESYGEAYGGAYANLTARYPGVHEIRVQCLDMKGAWKCAARGVIDV